MRLLVLPAALALFTACGGGEPTAESCASFCPDAATEAPAEAGEAAAPSAEGGTMTDFERDLLSPLLTDVREGVRPFHDEGIGLCQGKDKCDSYIGMSGGELAPGDYILQAELRVPRTGDKGTWKVRVDYDCDYVRTTDNGEDTSSKTSSREYDVVYAGDTRGYRLVPLRKITSPHERSSETCKWTITAPHPDGDKVYEGSWTAPADQ
jgi:hypothetical protein